MVVVFVEVVAGVVDAGVDVAAGVVAALAFLVEVDVAAGVVAAAAFALLLVAVGVA